VAVVGTGASAIQFVPEIQPHVDRLVVFQRTPAWVLRRSDRPVTGLERWLFRTFPALQRLQRRAQFAIRERLLYPVIRRRKAWRVVMQALGRMHLRQQVRDPRLRAKLKPDFEIGCKRILISNCWYRALDKPNVDVVAGGVREVREHSVVGSDGSDHVVDTIIFGTGFDVTAPKTIDRIHGRDGRSLGAVWHGAPRHYRAVSVAGFPNYFRLGGAGCGVGHGSMIYQLESQASYLLDALRTMRAHGATSVRRRGSRRRRLRLPRSDALRRARHVPAADAGRHARQHRAPARRAPRRREAPHAELREYPFDHFDFYDGASFGQALADQIEFLNRHLGGDHTCTTTSSSEPGRPAASSRPGSPRTPTSRSR
jgi:cation diffusion facilitator CzcD-associated flavoprotein CzcO